MADESNYTSLSYDKFGEDLATLKPTFILQMQAGPFSKAFPVTVAWTALASSFAMPWGEVWTLNKREVSYIKSHTMIDEGVATRWYEILTIRGEVIKLLPSPF